jgi:hypothetical protein
VLGIHNYKSNTVEHFYTILLAFDMTPEQMNLRFPLWQYLNQPLLGEKSPILNPRRFAYVYRVELLQRCWEKHCDAKGQY